jgi:hypothetical protein
MLMVDISYWRTRRASALVASPFEDDHVAGREVGHRDDCNLAFSHDLGVGGDELLQRLRGLLGAVLLDEAYGGVQHNDAHDGDGDVEVVLAARSGGKQRGDEHEQRADLEHDGEEGGELIEETVDDRARLCRQHVRPVLLAGGSRPRPRSGRWADVPSAS